MKRTVRTFAAVEINAAIRSTAEKLIESLRPAGADVKWVEPQNMHLTLKFLGEVPTNEIPHVCDSVARATAKIDPFEFEVRGAGAFPNATRPRTLWLGAGAGEEAMIALHGHVEKALMKLGYRKEHRRFHPHLTIGRVRQGGPGVQQLGELLKEQSDLEAGKTTVSHVVVFSSELDRSGPIYQALGRAKLGTK
ncbi:MAG TPA: RNA 2',3'-cyclic phosphodiesterase [Thermoguttaceae bacterium]|nr:RNA 2',3'-cyclic phosphodiesterase [Thermoguttaceae bacterium]